MAASTLGKVSVMGKFGRTILAACCFILLSASVSLAGNINELKQRAAAGNADALNELGKAYLSGKEVAQDYVQARKLFEKSAAQNFPAGQTNFGRMLVFGKGGAQDIKRGVALYEQAIAAGTHAAAYNLATLLEEGKRVPKNIPRAIELYELAAQNADYFAPQYRLGEIYRRGKTGEPELSKAIQWYREAAKRGHTDAKYQLALLLLSEHPGDTTDAQAFVLLTAAEIAGHNKAALKARTLEHKLGLNFSPSDKKNIYTLLNLSAKDLVLEGKKYANGLGSIKPNKALSKFYLSLARVKEPSEGRFALGVEHALKGTQKDAELAEKYFQAAASEGVDAAYYNLGWLHYTGALRHSDDVKAFEYFHKALSRQRSNASDYARLMLGVMYFQGRGTPRILDRSLIFFSQLSEKYVTSGKAGMPTNYIDKYAFNFLGEVRKEIQANAKNVDYSDEGFFFREEGSKTPMTVRMSSLIGEMSADWEHCGYAKLVKAFRKDTLKLIDKAKKPEYRKKLLHRIKRAYEQRKKVSKIAGVVQCDGLDQAVSRIKTLAMFVLFDWGIKEPPKDLGIEVVFNGKTLAVRGNFENPVVQAFKPELLRYMN